MYSVEADKSKRLVVISTVGRVTKEEAKQAAQQVRDILKDFAAGFRVLADFRWLESMDTAAAPHVAEIMDALTEKQVALVIRVMPDPHKDIGLNILSQFHYGPEIQITTFETLADALQSLVKEGEGTSEGMAARDQ
jgi:anti-anti-sigma regulatory factor